MIQTKDIQNDYPRPHLAREKWTNLNGEWEFAFDDHNQGVKDRWYMDKDYDLKIQVPFVYQCQRSGIHDTKQHPVVWYRKTLDSGTCEGRTILHFGAVDYKADVWVNGQHVGSHEGGHVPFSFEITEALLDGENAIVVRAEDYPFNLDLPRGKQFWKERSESIFYTPSTGIWQTVWLENLGQAFVEKVHLTPDLDSKAILMEYTISDTIHRLERIGGRTFGRKSQEGLKLGVTISLRGKIFVKDLMDLGTTKGKRTFYLDQGITLDWNSNEQWTWSPDRPVLFDMYLELYSGDQLVDEVKTYFGMRKVSIKDGVFLLNNHPFYQKLILDQGYWEESLLTPPDDQALIKDIELAKAMGFNGARKHQKIEDPRFLYHADRLGFLVWGEMANAYTYTKEYVPRMMAEWTQMIDRDYSHPSIVAWTPLNESWGVENIMNCKDQQAHAASMYYLTKSLDQTRPVISNDGWEHAKTDLVTIHDYDASKDILKGRYKDVETALSVRPAGKTIMASGWDYEGQPLLVTEFGGISFAKSDWEGWGYSSAVNDDDFLARYEAVVSGLLESPAIQGFCYTQLTDVEQEINGLLTYDRKPKVDLAKIRKINEGK